MKKLIIAAAVAASLLTSSVFAASQDGVIDMKKVFTQSTELKNAAAAIKKKVKPMQAAAQKKADALKHNMQFLQKNSATMSKSSLAALQKKIQQEQTEVQQAQMNLQQLVMGAQQTTMKAFMGSLKAATAKVAKKKGLVLVLPNNAVVYSDPSMDITDEVISELND